MSNPLPAPGISRHAPEAVARRDTSMSPPLVEQHGQAQHDVDDGPIARFGRRCSKAVG